MGIFSISLQQRISEFSSLLLLLKIKHIIKRKNTYYPFAILSKTSKNKYNIYTQSLANYFLKTSAAYFIVKSKSWLSNNRLNGQYYNP